MSARKSSHGTIFLIVSSGSPLALIASSLRSTSKKPVCPMTRSLHPPMAHCGQRVRFAATWREEFFEVPFKRFVLDLERSRFVFRGHERSTWRLRNGLSQNRTCVSDQVHGARRSCSAPTFKRTDDAPLRPRGSVRLRCILTLSSASRISDTDIGLDSFTICGRVFRVQGLTEKQLSSRSKGKDTHPGCP